MGISTCFLMCFLKLNLMLCILYLSGAPKAVSTPSKIECLTGIIIEMAALGSEHSIAVTGRYFV